jgi:hypothetical protein
MWPDGSHENRLFDNIGSPQRGTTDADKILAGVWVMWQALRLIVSKY